jgi:tRNA1(Val) A37 N6-methylase TrmN6
MATETVDRLLAGRLCITQPAVGYRVNADTLLLAAAVTAPPEGAGLEIGCGVGGALLAAALAHPAASFLGVEQDAATAELARRNIEANGLAERVKLLTGDGLALDPTHENRYDIAFANPPYFDARAMRPPLDERRAARVAVHPVDAWVKALAKAAQPGGAIAMIHRAERLADILAACAGRVGGVRVLGVHARTGAPATRVLVTGRKGSRGPLQLLPGLVLHEGEGWTDQASRLFTGEDRLSLLWS